MITKLFIFLVPNRIPVRIRTALVLDRHILGHQMTDVGIPILDIIPVQDIESDVAEVTKIVKMPMTYSVGSVLSKGLAQRTPLWASLLLINERRISQVHQEVQIHLKDCLSAI